MVRRKKVITGFTIVVFLVVGLYGCHPLERQLYGIYASNEKGVVDSIFLYKDHHYFHKMFVKGGFKKQSGQWDYSFGTISFFDFKSYAEDLPVESGTRITEANISLRGGIEIEINSDSDIGYIKVK
jgi:hypothetical protein